MVLAFLILLELLLVLTLMFNHAVSDPLLLERLFILHVPPIFVPANNFYRPRAPHHNRSIYLEHMRYVCVPMLVTNNHNLLDHSVHISYC